MATTSASSCFLSAPFWNSNRNPPHGKARSISSPRHSCITVCSKEAITSLRLSSSEPSTATGSRRQLLEKILLSFFVVPVRPSVAADEGSEYKSYSNDKDSYTLLVPADWTKGTGKATGQRDVTAFFPVDDVSTNVNIVITGVGADYTTLGSFGAVDSFAETLVNGLDRSWKKPPGQAAKLLSAKSKNGFYYVEYTIQPPGEKKTHLLSVVGMRFNGWYNRLYTVTGQYSEENQDKYGPLLEKVVNSFKFA